MSARDDYLALATLADSACPMFAPLVTIWAAKAALNEIDRLRLDCAYMEDIARCRGEENERLRAALTDAAGPPGSTCTANNEMSDAEWMRRQWRNALDQWQFWHAAYVADVGKPEFEASWRIWRERALAAEANLQVRSGAVPASRPASPSLLTEEQP